MTCLEFEPELARHIRFRVAIPSSEGDFAQFFVFVFLMASPLLLRLLLIDLYLVVFKFNFDLVPELEHSDEEDEVAGWSGLIQISWSGPFWSLVLSTESVLLDTGSGPNWFDSSSCCFRLFFRILLFWNLNKTILKKWVGKRDWKWKWFIFCVLLIT